MQNELDEHTEEYRSLTYEYWCDLLSTIEVEDERKRSAAQIKNIASARVASISDNEESTRIQRKNKARPGVLRFKTPQKNVHKHHGIQRYCVIFKKAGIPDRNFMSHSAKDCTGVCTNRTIKYRMGGYVVSRTATVNQYKKSEENGRKR